MQTLKIILGIILAIATLNTMITMFSEEHGAGLGGALVGFIILGSFAGWLIYSGVKASSKKQN